MKDLRKDFDNFTEQNFNGNPAFCPDGQCASDEEVDLQDYPSYTEALSTICQTDSPTCKWYLYLTLGYQRYRFGCR